MSTSSPYPTLVLASRNAKKMRELVALLTPWGITVRSCGEFPQAPDVEETGHTFAENAGLKASQVAQVVRHWTLADDSGLAVDYLQGAPGVYSARYAGPYATDDENNQKVIAAMAGVPADQRGARFVCHLALSDPTGRICLNVEESCRGRLLETALGGAGFGYDPLFWILEYHQTFGQLGLTVKEFISHRSRALRQMIPQMIRLWENQ